MSKQKHDDYKIYLCILLYNSGMITKSDVLECIKRINEEDNNE